MTGLRHRSASPSIGRLVLRALRCGGRCASVQTAPFAARAARDGLVGRRGFGRRRPAASFSREALQGQLAVSRLAAGVLGDGGDTIAELAPKQGSLLRR